MSSPDNLYHFIKNLHRCKTISAYEYAMEQIRKELNMSTRLSKEKEIEIMSGMNAFYFGYISTPKDFKFYEVLLEAGWYLPKDTKYVFYPEQVEILAARGVKKVPRHQEIKNK